MKIDEACINHNAVKIIEELSASAYDFCSLKAEDSMSERENQNYALMTLGNIVGVLDMARDMKEVLKA